MGASRGEALGKAIEVLKPETTEAALEIARVVFGAPPANMVHEHSWTSDSGRPICKCGEAYCPKMPPIPPPPRDAHGLSWVTANGRRICTCGKGDCGWELHYSYR